MTQKFISRQKSQSPTTSPPVQTSRFASRPFAEPVQQKAQQPDLQTILQRAERAGNPTEKMAWGNTQPEVQRQGVTENETEESKVQKEAATDTQSQDLEEQKDTEVQTQLDSTIQQQESSPKPEEETVQQQSTPEEEQKDTEVQTQLDSTIQQQESSPKPEEETVQQQSSSEEEQKDTEVQTQLDSTIQQQESEQKPEEETVQQQSSPEEEQKDTEVQTQLDSTIQQQESSPKPEEETVQQQSTPEEEQKDSEVQTKLGESEQKPEEETVQQQSTPEEEQKNSEVQTKLTVGQPGDKYEKEADNVAAKVMTMPEMETEENKPQFQDVEQQEKSTVQKQPIAQSITAVQRRLESSVNLKSVRDNKAGKAQVTPSLENRLASEKGGGSLLPEDTRSFMESRFGADFSEVRVHADSQAAQMNQELGAQAFTHGNDIYFNSGKYDPSSGKGKELLAHELTHTIQQTGGKTAKSNNNSNNKKSSKANKVQMKSMTPLAEPTIQRREETSSEAVQTVPTPSTVEGGGTSDLPEATGGETAPSAQTPASSGSTPPSEGGGASSSGGGSSAPNSPEGDPKFQAVVSKSKNVAEDQKQHEPAQNESQEAQNAAKSPSNEVESKAQDQQVGEMEQQQPGEFDPEAFKSAIFDKLKEITPKNEEEAHKFKEENQVDEVRDSVSSQVGDEQEQAAAPIEEKTEEEPDTSGIEPRQETPMSAPDTGTAPGDVNAENAAPKPKSEAEVSAPLEANSQELDQQMASENITDEQLANSNEPEFQTALDEKKKAKADAAEAPKEYRQKEQQTLAQAKSEAQSTAANQTEAMHGQRQDAMSQVEGLQGQTKGNDEQKRTEIADHINGIYERVKGEVDSSLSSLEQDVISKFDAAANQAKQELEDYVDRKLADYRRERYGTPVIGAFRRVRDVFAGLPDEVNRFFEEGRQLYLNRMDVALTEIANTVSERLTAAKQKITEGRHEIKEYVASLPEDLQHIGREAATNIQSKFDDLEQQVQDKYDQLVDTLAERYRDRLQEVDDRIEEMKAANRGLIDKAIDAIGGVIKTIQEIKAMLENILSKAKEAILAIIQDPIGFLNNLVTGLRQGLENFLGNIANHLQSGLVGWLTGTMGSMGIQIPEDIFSLKGIFSLTTQILGLSWNYIRGKATKMFGEKTVTGMEESVGMVQVLRDQGPTGLWEQVQSDFGDLKESVMGEIKNLLIVQVIQAGVKWILGLLNPASAFVKAAMAIYDIIMFFVNQGSQVIELVNAVIDAVIAIAKGAVGGAAKLVEDALVKALPVVIGFLASLLGIGGMAKKVQDIVEKVRKRIDDAIEKVLKKARKLFKGKKGKENKDQTKTDENKDERTKEEKDKDLEKAKQALKELISKSENTKEVEQQFPAIKKKFGLKKLEWNKLGTPAASIDIEINPKAKIELENGKLTLTGQEPSNVKLDQEVTFGTDKIDIQVKKPDGKREKKGSQIVGTSMIASKLGPNHPKGAESNGRLPNVMQYLPTETTSSRESKYIRGHLLNADLGGPNDDKNLFPITASANTKHKDFVEETVKEWVNIDRYWVYYEVKIENINSQFYMKNGKITGSVNADIKCEASKINSEGKRIKDGIIKYTIPSKMNTESEEREEAIDPTAPEYAQEDEEQTPVQERYFKVGRVEVTLGKQSKKRELIKNLRTRNISLLEEVTGLIKSLTESIGTSSHNSEENQTTATHIQPRITSIQNVISKALPERETTINETGLVNNMKDNRTLNTELVKQRRIELKLVDEALKPLDELQQQQESSDEEQQNSGQNPEGM